MLSRGSTVVVVRWWFAAVCQFCILQPHTFYMNQPKATVDLQVVTWVSLPTWLGDCRGIQENALEKGDVELLWQKNRPAEFWLCDICLITCVCVGNVANLSLRSCEWEQSVPVSVLHCPPFPTRATPFGAYCCYVKFRVNAAVYWDSLNTEIGHGWMLTNFPLKFCWQRVLNEMHWATHLAMDTYAPNSL
jgi:hypothetical protein